MSLFLWGGLLLIVTAAAMGLIDETSSGMAVLAGGAVPLLISTVSLHFYASRGLGLMRIPAAGANRVTTWAYQRFLLINFLLKALLIGLWTVFVLLATTWPQIPFVISLLVNFLVWHLFEAFSYQRQLAAFSRPDPTARHTA